MVLNNLSVTFIPTEVLKHSKKDKPLGKFEYRVMRIRLYVLWHVLRNIFTGVTSMRCWPQTTSLSSTEKYLKELP